ncbi:HD domain-containing protein [Thermovibrio sp.]
MEKRVHKITFYHPKVEKVAECLEGKGYLVGGFVRDRLLRVRKDYLDVDVVVKELEERELSCLIELFKSKGFTIKKTKEVLSFTFPSGRFDFSTMEGERIEEDLKRRDFTVNAIAVELSEIYLPFNDDVVLIDPTGGYEDLIRGVIRPISEENVKEDPLRVLRGIRLKNLLDFSYSKEFKEIAPKYSERLREVPEERIKAELLKLLEGERFSEAVKEMAEFKALFPVFKELEGIEKIPPSGLHAYDLLEHTLKTVEFTEKFALKEAETVFGDYAKELLKEKGALLLAALYHDVGKPLTVEEKDGRLTFYNHDKVGAPIAREAVIRLGFGKEWGKAVFFVVKNHLRPFFLFELSKEKKLTDKAVYRFFRDCKGYHFHTLTLSVGDFMATSPRMEEKVEEYLDFLVFLTSFYRERIEGLKPLLTGEEIIEIKGFKGPNKLVGKIKERLLEAQVLGKVKSKEEAVKFVKGFTTGEEVENAN